MMIAGNVLAVLLLIGCAPSRPEVVLSDRIPHQLAKGVWVTVLAATDDSGKLQPVKTYVPPGSWIVSNRIMEP